MSSSKSENKNVSKVKGTKKGKKTNIENEIHKKLKINKDDIINKVNNCLDEILKTGEKTKKNSKVNKGKTKVEINVDDADDINYYKDTFEVIDSYFNQMNNKQLLKHQLDSFQHFCNPQLKEIISQFNPIIIYHDYMPEFNKHRIELHINFREYYLGKPLIYENDGSYKPMTPELARLRHLTYSSPLSINIHLKRILYQGAKFDKEDVQEIMLKKINFGKIPIMTYSKYCYLSENKFNNVINEGECKYEKGGCFIIGGNEKVIVSQERIAENKVFVFNNQRQNKSLNAEVRSIPDCQFSVAMSNVVKYIYKTNIIEVESSNFRTGINIFLLFRLLGIETDKKLVSYIVWDIENKKSKELLTLVRSTLENYKVICKTNKLTNNKSIKEYILKYVNFKGVNKDIKMTQQGKLDYLERSLKVELLPHLGDDKLKKVFYLGYMTQKLLKVHLGYLKHDDRDSYENKRVDTPGILMASLFRQNFNRLVKDMKKSISKELKSNKSGKDVFEIINVNNIYKIIKSTMIEGGLKYALATGNWGAKSTNGPRQKVKVGTAQVLNRLSNLSCLSHLRRINSPSEKNSAKIVAPRKIHSSQWGFICPAETPEGAPVGLVKNMSLTCEITVQYNSRPVINWFENNNVKPLTDIDIKECLYNAKVFVNGNFLGIHNDPNKLVNDFKDARRSGIINIYISIVWDTIDNNIFVYSDSGRVIRPLYVVKNNKLVFNKKYLEILRQNKNYIKLISPYDQNTGKNKELLSCIEYIDCEEVNNCLIAMDKDYIGEKYNSYIRNFTHCEIHPGLILSVIACIIPFPDHNQSPRNTYQSAMCKQGMGICSTNFNSRMDTLGYLMNNLERPIVGTRFGKYVNYDMLPNGLNAVVAIACYTGYNQEDSLILNRDALNRGMFRCTFTRTYKDDEKKIQSSGKEEKFCRPNPDKTKNMKPGDYSKLDEHGFVKINEYVDNNDIIIGKVLPIKQKDNNGHQLFKDCSTSLRMNESGYVDRVYSNRNADGFKFTKVKIRSERIPQIGDKFSSRCGQKGTCGVTYPQEHMPFNKDGISPDAIMNPHAIPSRMTIGQLLECIMGKSSVMLGGLSDCTPFHKVDPEKVGDILQKNGFERYGNEILYNGITGKQMECQIFMGPTYYQRLKHMVSDKMHSRSSGPVVQLTRQPAEGRSRDGGLRIGEMERDCMIAHGTLAMLKERMMDVSDLFEVYVCRDCGLFAEVNPEKDIYKCSSCERSSNFGKVKLPYACKLLFQELQGMIVAPRIKF